MVASQSRPPLAFALQQFAATAAASLLSQQLEEFAAAGSMSADKDVAVCDATSGTFILTLPGSDVVLGKLYGVVETSGANNITVDAAGAGTIAGSATLTVPAGESAVLLPISIDPVTQLVTWVRQSLTAPAGGDASALHVDVDGEIAGIAAKAAPGIADTFVLNDAADADAVASATLGAMLAAPGQVTNLDAATPLAADKLAFEDASDGGAMKETTIGAIPIAQAQVAGVVLDIAADDPCAILSTTCAIRLQSSTTGAKTITTSSSYAGQVIPIFLLAASGGSYAVGLDAGALTFNAASESGVIVRNAANDAWIAVGLSGATIV